MYPFVLKVTLKLAVRIAYKKRQLWHGFNNEKTSSLSKTFSFVFLLSKFLQKVIYKFWFAVYSWLATKNMRSSKPKKQYCNHITSTKEQTINWRPDDWSLPQSTSSSLFSINKYCKLIFVYMLINMHVLCFVETRSLE